MTTQVPKCRKYIDKLEAYVKDAKIPDKITLLEQQFNNWTENSKDDKNYIPTLDEDGEIEYLGKRYSMKEINVIEKEEWWDVLDY